MTISRVGVLGGGQMGSGIAEVCARAGLEVVVSEVSPELADASRRRIERSLDRAARAGKIDAASREPTLARLRFVTGMDALADRQLVVEAVVEDADVKREAFARLGRAVTDPGAILASNTSSIPITRLAVASGRPGSVIGMHFFNPVPVLRLMELIPTLLTDPEVTRRAGDFAREALGRKVIRAPDRAGFVVNALLVPFLLAAIRMLESGFATREEIDAGLVEGCSHPMGPLALSDLIGLDTLGAVADSLHAEFKEPLYAPPPLLSRMVEAGRLGRKTGRGFYEYPR